MKNTTSSKDKHRGIPKLDRCVRAANAKIKIHISV